MRQMLLILLFWVFGNLAAGSEVVPVPESEQAARAMKIIDDYLGAVSQKRLGFSVATAVTLNQPRAARSALQKMENQKPD